MNRLSISFRWTSWFLAAILAAGVSLSSICMRPCCDRAAGACCAAAPEAAQAGLPSADATRAVRSSHDLARVLASTSVPLTLFTSSLAQPSFTTSESPESPPPILLAVLRI